ncbi:MAG: histidinol dehydrogenase [Bacteroidia bacterium]|nr:histidinol dehydrogenase [Bacteroidia bacterium]MCX7763485.1 histidinol dehydrogenase [Bacteroidia bacterium]MDW8057401.1 histidinol dehydrogenase [Bacteroidia bacterium]
MKWCVYRWEPGFSPQVLRAAQPPLPSVEAIFEAVEKRGDAALFELTQQYDGVALERLRIPTSEIERAEVPAPLVEAIHTAYQNLRTFHLRQLPEEVVVETQPGVLCGLRYVPLRRVGLYVPGGTAPLVSTVLMLGVAAQVAGVPEIALATPPAQDGRVPEAILYAARLCGIYEIYSVGGAQAIAAFALGTESIPAVDKIAGPGNRFVQAAKLEAARRGVGIDMPAGPSEVVVVCDETAPPAWMAADLLAQAEHGPDSLVGLITPIEDLIYAIQTEMEKQLSSNPRRSFIEESLEHSWALLVPDVETGVKVADAIAPEHLILACGQPERFLSQLYRAGSVFLGPLTPESAGDYASGTNHVLPTGGMARSYGSLTALSFMRSFTYQRLTPEGVRHLTPTVLELAKFEGLPAHAEAMRFRYEAL